MKIITRYFNYINTLYNYEVSGLPLAIFRIFYGLVLFGEILQIFYFRHLIFDPIPYSDIATFSVTPFFVIWLAAIGLIIFGLFTKTATLINYLFTVFIMGFSFHSGPAALHEYHLDSELITVAFVLMFMPISRRLSLDRLIEILKYSSVHLDYFPKMTVSSINYVLLTLVAGLIYFDSIFYKYSSPMWLNGLGIWLPASQPWASWLNLNWILNQKYLILFLGYFTLLFQTTYIFLVWFKKLKPIYIWVGIGLHIGIFFAFPIPWFALGMVAIYVGLISSETYLRFIHFCFRKSKKTLIFLYDKECPLCNRLRLIIEYIDYRKAILFQNVQDHALDFRALDAIEKKELLNNVYSIDHFGRIYSGIDTYHQLMSRVWLFKPISYLLYIPPLKWLGNLFYNYIAKHRIRYGCNEMTCGISTKRSTFPLVNDEIKILQTLSAKDIKVKSVGIFIAFIVISQLILIQKSFLMQHIYSSVGMSETTIQTINSFSEKYQNIVYPYTGLTAHPVFMDYHFKNYNHEIAIIYQNGDQSAYLPIIDEKGQASWYASGREWVYWSFRTNITTTGETKTLDLCQFELNTNKILYFWGHQKKIDLSQGHFIVQMKQLNVPYHFEYNHLKNMMEKSWVPIGEVTFKNNTFVYTWKRDELLDYMK